MRVALAGLRFRADPYVGVILYQRADSMSAAHPVECARAQIRVLQKAADRTGRSYAEHIGTRAWRLAGVCAGYGDWPYVNQCLQLCREIGYERPRHENWMVQAMARVSPVLAVRARETVIRVLKPQLRAGMARASDRTGQP